MQENIVKRKLNNMEIREEGKDLQGTDAIPEAVQPWPWWAHSVSQVSASLPVDNGPVHFLIAIILKYYILLLYPQSISLIWTSNSKFHFWFSIPHGLQQSTPHPSAYFSLFQTTFLFCFSTEIHCFPVLFFNLLSVSLHLSISPFNSIFSYPSPKGCSTQKHPSDNYWKHHVR